jgi:hypothetical protein
VGAGACGEAEVAALGAVPGRGDDVGDVGDEVLDGVGEPDAEPGTSRLSPEAVLGGRVLGGAHEPGTDPRTSRLIAELVLGG